MIDSEARLQAAILLRQFQSQEITNTKLDKTWPESHDPAIGQIFDAVWGTYSDLNEQRYAPSTESDDLLQRCIGFLESRHPYSWPVPNPLFQLLGMPLSLITFGIANRIIWRKYIFPDYWPFPTKEAREASIRTEPFSST